MKRLCTAWYSTAGTIVDYTQSPPPSQLLTGRSSLLCVIVSIGRIVVRTHTSIYIYMYTRVRMLMFVLVPQVGLSFCDSDFWDRRSAQSAVNTHAPSTSVSILHPPYSNAQNRRLDAAAALGAVACAFFFLVE